MCPFTLCQLLLCWPRPFPEVYMNKPLTFSPSMKNRKKEVYMFIAFSVYACNYRAKCPKRTWNRPFNVLLTRERKSQQGYKYQVVCVCSAAASSKPLQPQTHTCICCRAPHPPVVWHQAGLPISLQWDQRQVEELWTLQQVKRLWTFTHCLRLKEQVWGTFARRKLLPWEPL